METRIDRYEVPLRFLNSFVEIAALVTADIIEETQVSEVTASLLVAEILHRIAHSINQRAVEMKEKPTIIQ